MHSLRPARPFSTIALCGLAISFSVAASISSLADDEHKDEVTSPSLVLEQEPQAPEREVPQPEPTLDTSLVGDQATPLPERGPHFWDDCPACGMG